MGRILLLSIVLIFAGVVLFIGGSYLVVFWRDTMRRWRLEKHADEKRQIRESTEEFIKATETLEQRSRKPDVEH